MYNCYKKRQVTKSAMHLFINSIRELKVLETETLNMDLDHKYSKNPDFIRDCLAMYLKIEDVILF